jgi:hypothetical protein
MHTKRAIWIEVSFLITTCIGVALLIIAARLYAHAAVYEHHNWVPLTLPVSLEPKTIRTPQITTDFDGDYEILIELEKIHDFHKMECMLGDPYPNTCKGIPNLIDISWRLLEGEGENVVSQGDSGDYLGAAWSATVERMIGKFRGQVGHNYVLVLHVKRDASELNAGRPRIKVQVPLLGAPKDYGAAAYVQRMFASMVGLVGAIILVGPLFLWKVKNRQ